MKNILVILILFFTSCGPIQEPLLEITRNVLQGDNIDIKINNLLPNHTYTIHLQRYSFSNSNLPLYSYAQYVSNSEGGINIDKDESIGGDFIGKDSLGLFYSLKKEKDLPNFLSNIQSKKKIDKASHYFSIQIESKGEIIKEERFSLKILNEDVKSYEVNRNGIKLNLFISPNATKTVIVLGGSEGNNLYSGYVAQLLASKGFNAAAISYFGGENQTKVLSKIPLEIIDSSLNIIKEKTNLDNLYFLGWSKGSELALIYSSINKDLDIDGVIAFSPSSSIFQGLSSISNSSWTYKGEELNFVEYSKTNNITSDANGKIIYKDLYEKSLEENGIENEIQVENISGNILLFSGGEDNLWPSKLMAGKIADRLERNSMKNKVQSFVYLDAGHAIIPPSYVSQYSLNTSELSYGGSFKENAYAQLDSWEKTIYFLTTK